jgi:hypothetical protein
MGYAQLDRKLTDDQTKAMSLPQHFDRDVSRQAYHPGRPIAAKRAPK